MSPTMEVGLTDRQRFDALRCTGNREIRTPHLDALAASGGRLTQVVTSGCAACGPYTTD